MDNALVLYLNFRTEPVTSRRGDTVELLRKQVLWLGNLGQVRKILGWFRFLPWMVVLIAELKKTLRNRFRKK